jgi:hypothetical protein
MMLTPWIKASSVSPPPRITSTALVTAATTPLPLGPASGGRPAFCAPTARSFDGSDASARLERRDDSGRAQHGDGAAQKLPSAVVCFH